MPQQRRSDLTEPQGVNAGPPADTEQTSSSGPDPSAAATGSNEIAGRHPAPSDAELEQRVQQQADGAADGSELTTAGVETPGPGQDLSAGEG
ncbi:hypothetical protein K6U06_16470 [Acidiferrimicrobium sp. IK]|uniref:hypothetical protein n=1 Tax=Acidiferrimicrobium sp. IK TaxID=2871700 RepID=UPI0021CB6401|nr:hypothetical protein [Acidiferrimicrobium sp. IK]MCU4185966.1 hypothetical protein [Acidiferrimicrobium sp. IK]